MLLSGRLSRAFSPQFLRNGTFCLGTTANSVAQLASMMVDGGGGRGNAGCAAAVFVARRSYSIEFRGQGWKGPDTSRTHNVIPPTPMTEQDCAERVLKTIRGWDRFPADRADKLTMDARFVEDLGLDSLDLVEITLAVEDEFQWEIEDDVAHAFKTVRDVYNYVAEREMVTDNEGI
ncbi:hypothetical protein niasHT_035220 [Heterodera trifolii]|uniref:Acyl carrier protein n=1 Tax=Heterodera trifolii TaxID=157864 RepID=A0ABD2IXN1_9BILA